MVPSSSCRRGDAQAPGLVPYKIGVGTAHPAGATLFAPQRQGELTFRVRDNRYDDHSGAFEVDVIVVSKMELIRFRGRLLRPTFWAEVVHEDQQKAGPAGRERRAFSTEFKAEAVRMLGLRLKSCEYGHTIT